MTFSTRFGSALADPAGAHPGDEGEPARLVVGVELRGERDRVVGAGGRPELDADRVADVREQLDVGAVELTGPLADPDEVAGHVVRLLGARVDAGQRVLVLEDQRLVAGVEVDPVELVGVGADGLHEGERPVDLLAELLVAPADRRAAHEVGVPGVHLAQVGVPTGDERADEVQRGRGRVVDLDQPLRVGDPGLRGEVEAVDGVAAVRRQGHPVAGLEVRGPRLGVLAGDPAELHDRHGGGVGQHDRHLQQHPQLVAHVVGGHPVEGLGAVPALQQERLAAGDRGQLRLQVVALTGEDQRRHARGAWRRRRRAPRGRASSAAGRDRGRAARRGRGRASHRPSLRPRGVPGTLGRWPR